MWKSEPSVFLARISFCWCWLSIVRYSGSDSKMPMVLLAVIPVTASAGAIMTVTRSPARALNPRVPSTAVNRLLAVFFWAGIGYRVRYPPSNQPERMPAMPPGEYLPPPLMIPNPAAILNNWGARGWNLVQVVPGPEGGLVPYLKPPKPREEGAA